MSKVYKAVYLLVFVCWVRKIIGKMIDFDAYDFRVCHEDESGCWNIMLFDTCVGYSYNKGKVLDWARRIKGIAKDAPLYVVEAEDYEVDDVDCAWPLTEEERTAIMSVLGDE